VSVFSQQADRERQRDLQILNRDVQPIYRKPSKKELAVIAPNRELYSAYAAVLKLPDTGLVKLVPDTGCANNSKVLVATEHCLKYTMPGNGSSFSFRTETYRIPRLSDVTFTDGSFQAGGVRLHGIFVRLGDVQVENVTVATAGMQYLVDFTPETEFEKSKEVDKLLTEGIEKDGFLYRRGLFITEKTTFALRSVAYGGKYMRATSGVTYNEMDFDRRRDVLVVFRIVETDPDGSVTILWRRLWDRDSPDLKRDPNDSRDSRTWN
jgi:hypothetical protein